MKDGRVFLPEALRERLMKSFHGNGVHFGIQRTIDLIALTYYWSSLRSDVQNWIRRCDVCSRVKSNAKNRMNPVSLPNSKRPFQRVSMDYAGPLSRTQSGNRYFLVMVDDFSRYLKVFPARDCSAATTIKCFKQMCLEEGAPEEILSDNGTHFTADVFTELLSMMRVNHIRTAPYHPSSNGMAERAVRTMKTLIQTNLIEKVKHASAWDQLLPKLVFRYNATAHPATGISPFVIARGRTPPSETLSWLDVNLPTRQCSESWERIVERSKSFKARNCQNKGGKELPVLDEGREVWIRKNKIKDWSEGKISRVVTPTTYYVKRKDKPEEEMVHRDQILLKSVVQTLKNNEGE
jgi:transposase InsO family protein